MSDEAELIVDCAAAPDDDRPRLVYADFLQQRGDPRGDFIALQCAYEVARAADDDSLSVLLAKRWRKLLDEHEVQWVAGAWSVLPRSMKFRRGFIEHALLDDAEELGNVMTQLRPYAPLLRALAAAHADARGHRVDRLDAGSARRALVPPDEARVLAREPADPADADPRAARRGAGAPAPARAADSQPGDVVERRRHPAAHAPARDARRPQRSTDRDRAAAPRRGGAAAGVARGRGARGGARGRGRR